MRKTFLCCLAAWLLLLLAACGEDAWEYTDAQAQKYIDKEDYATAESIYLRYIEKEPTDDDGYFALYLLYEYDMDNSEKAKEIALQGYEATGSDWLKNYVENSDELEPADISSGYEVENLLKLEEITVGEMPFSQLEEDNLQTLFPVSNSHSFHADTQNEDDHDSDHKNDHDEDGWYLNESYAEYDVSCNKHVYDGNIYLSCNISGINEDRSWITGSGPALQLPRGITPEDSVQQALQKIGVSESQAQNWAKSSSVYLTVEKDALTDVWVSSERRDTSDQGYFIVRISYEKEEEEERTYRLYYAGEKLYSVEYAITRYDDE